MLDETEKDALTELVNIAVSGAAVRLRAMVGAEVKLTVPAVAVAQGDEAVDMMVRLGLTNVTAVRQSFAGRLTGETMLVFPDDNHGALVRAVVGPELDDVELAALTADALGEIGNILLLGFLSIIGKMLGVEFSVSIPRVETAQPAEIFTGDAEQVALLVYVNFTISGQDIRGYFGLVLGIETFAVLRQILQAFIDSIL